MGTIKAVTLDLWNTLIADTTAAERAALRFRRLRKMLAPHGVMPSDADLERAFRVSWDAFDETWVGERRTPTTEESTRVLLAALGVSVPDAERRAIARMLEDLILEVPPEPVPGAQEVLRELHGRYRLGLISDTGLSPGRNLRLILDRLGLLKHLDALYFSDEGGMSKPDERVFAAVLHDLGDVPPSQAIHVGDMQRTDIAGAQAAGLRAVHFVGVSDVDLPVSTAEHVLYDLAELPGLLARLEREDEGASKEALDVISSRRTNDSDGECE